MQLIKVPESAIPYIRAQRTSFKNEVDPRESWVKCMNEIYDSLIPHLPEKVNAVLDIGCGLAGIDILLAKNYPGAVFHLLDKSEPTPYVKYGFRKESHFYTSREVVFELLSQNIDGRFPFLWHEAPEGIEEIPLFVDLIMSFGSWGFHYPITNYLKAVRRLITDKGTVYADIRVGTTGQAILGAAFRKVEVIAKNQKAIGVLCSGVERLIE